LVTFVIPVSSAGKIVVAKRRDLQVLRSVHRTGLEVEPGTVVPDLLRLAGAHRERTRAEELAVDRMRPSVARVSRTVA
jgi:hypothetical protein